VDKKKYRYKSWAGTSVRLPSVFTYMHPTSTLAWIIWNTFLAFMPVALGWASTTFTRGRGRRRLLKC